MWRHINIDGYWLTKTIIDDEDKIHSGRVLDYERVTNCLQRIGNHIQLLNILQSQHFVSLYQFFVVLGSYFDKVIPAQYFKNSIILRTFFFLSQMQNNKTDSHSSPNIRQLTFNFPCEHPIEMNPNGIKLFGIGGRTMKIIIEN